MSSFHKGPGPGVLYVVPATPAVLGRLRQLSYTVEESHPAQARARVQVWRTSRTAGAAERSHVTLSAPMIHECEPHEIRIASFDAARRVVFAPFPCSPDSMTADEILALMGYTPARTP